MKPFTRGLAACSLVLPALALSPSVAANETIDGMALARANVCLSCHQVDARRVGPPFRAIAQRYAQGERAATIEYLARAIREGSRGRWGALTMPAQPHVDDQEADELARWILSLDPSCRTRGTPRRKT